MNNEQSERKLVPFPRQLRVVPAEPRAYAAPTDITSLAAEHDGCVYQLEALLRQLPAHCIREVEATTPLSGQEL